MGGFFDPNSRAVEVFPMCGAGHIAVGLILFHLNFAGFRLERRLKEALSYE